MTNNTLLSQLGSKLGLDRRKKAILIMLFALFSTFLSQSQFVINTQPPKLQRICIPNPALSARLQVAAVTCSGYNLTYQWQRNRPASIGGSGSFVDLANPTAGYTGVNTPTLDIVNDSLIGKNSYYQYRCFITSSGSGGTCPSFSTLLTNVSEIIGVRKPIVKYLTPQDTSVCESYSGSDSKYPIRARIIGLSRKDTLRFTWRQVDKPSFTDAPLSAHPAYTGTISTWTQTPDTITLIKYITLNTANNTPIVLSMDQSNFYLEINSFACGISDTNSVPKRNLTVNPVPDLTINTPNINICQNDPFSMQYVVSNAQHDAYRTPLPINWNLASITGDAALKALLTTTTGTGNGTITVNVPTLHGLSVGIHTITFNTILNTTDAVTSGNCGRGFTATTITVNVYPKPVVTFLDFIPASSGDSTLCQGTSGKVRFQVSNATFNSTNVGWTVTVTDPDGILAPATLTGQGNQIVTNTIPTTLAIGPHSVTLIGIATSGTPSTCNGTVGALATIKLNVIPTPTASINTTITEERCLGATATSFSITVSNAIYPGGIRLNWLLNITDSTTGTVSTFAGKGDTTYNYTTSNSLGLGTHTIRLNSINLVSPTGTMVHPNCGRSLFGQTKTIRVNPIPSASLSSTSGTACEGSTPTAFNLVVTGANYPPPLAWSIFTSGTFQAAATGSSIGSSTALTGVFFSTGSGNGSFSFTPPANLAPGRYTLTLDSIKLANTPSCTQALAVTYTLDIFPKATASIIGVPMLDSLCEGGTTTYNIAISNAQYAPLGIDRAWTLQFSNALNGTMPGSPISGTGNTVLGGYTTSSALTTGNYNLQLISITNTTNSCTNSLPGTLATSTLMTRKIYPKPKANLSVANISICEGSATTFTVIISNAVKQPGAVNMPWTLSTSGTFEAAPAGSPSVSSTAINFSSAASGTGNNAGISISVPNTLAAGRYIFTLSNPVLNVSPLFCTGTTGPNTTITINVRPKPSLTVTPTIDSVCSGLSKTFTIAIGNIFYEPLSGTQPNGLTWSFTSTSTLGTLTPVLPSPKTGQGNTTLTYTTPTSLSVGAHTLDITSLDNTFNACTYARPGVEYTLNVMQRPTLTINSPTPTEVCFNTGAVVNYSVTNVAVGRSWSFTYTAANTSPSGAVTISGTGPVSGATFTTNPFTTTGAGTIVFNPIILIGSGSCGATTAVSTINLSVAGIPNVTALSITGIDSICGNASSGVSKVDFRVTVNNMVVGPKTKTWQITYNIIGTQDTIVGGTSDIFMQTGKTVTGSGNGSFTFSTPNQTYNGNPAFSNGDPSEMGIQDIRNIVITKIEFTGNVGNLGQGILCSNSTITANTTTFKVNPRPRFTFTNFPSRVCQGQNIVAGYNVDGLKSGQSGTLTWVGVNPNQPAINQSFNGPSTISQSIVTGNTVNLGTSTITVSAVVNSTTGCTILTPPTNYVATILIDTPSVAGTLKTITGTAGYTVCEGNNTGTLVLGGTVVGTVQKWEYSEDDGYTWRAFANTTKTYTFTNQTLTRRWRVVVKNLTCDTARSNDVIVFVHPQPKVQIVSATTGICVNDTVKFTINVTGVPTNHTWKFTYTKAGFSSGNGNGVLTGKGSGNFSYFFAGITTTSLTGTITLKNITNDTTTCNNDYSSNSAYVITVLVGSNSTAGAIGLVTSTGTVSLPQNVCKGSNVKLKYLGAGNVSWWYSTTGTGTYPNGWDSTFNPSYTFNAGVIDTLTKFKVKVKFGTCSSVLSGAFEVHVVKLPTATISGSDTICENTSFVLGVQINGEPGSTVSLKWLEGSTNKSGNFALGTNPPTTNNPNTISTGVLTTTTNVILQSIQYTTAPACPQPLYTNAIATVTVNPQPNVTINSVTTPVCQGSTSVVSYTVSGVAATTTWKLYYRVGASTPTPISGKGSGTFNVTTASLSTAGSIVVTFDSIATTNIRTNCRSGVLSGVSLSIQVDATTTPGSVASDVTICTGGNATVTFTPGNGIINKWNTSTSGPSGSYSSVTSTSNTLNLTNVIANSWITATSKNGVCAEATTTTPVAITVRSMPTATISGSTTICSGATASLTIAVSNTFSNPWTIDYLEGVTSKTKTGTGDGNVTITTSALTTKTDITLQLITMNNSSTSTNPNCGPTTLTSTVTVDVNPNPVATLNSVSTPVCQSTTANSSFSVTVTGVPTGQGWSLAYKLGSTAQTPVTNLGSGTFTFPLTLNTPGTVTLTLTSITNTGTSCTTNPLTGSVSANIVVDATTVAGILTNNGASVVCTGTNSGSFTYSGGTGAIVRWEQSSNGGTTWTNAGTTSSTFNWSNLTATTKYRAVVKNGSCAEAMSVDSTITVRPLPTATISGSQTICQGSTATMTITVANRFGNPWSVTLLEGTTTRTITTPTFTTNVLNGKTDITLQSIVLTHTPTNTNPGGCPNTISSTATVDVTPMPIANIIYVGTPICQGNTSTINFSVGNISTGQAWRLDYTEAGVSKSATGSGPGTFTINTSVLNTVGANTVTLNSITITSSTPTCTQNLSGQSLNINVDATTVAGTIAGASTVCKGSNSGTLTYSGGNGTIVRWEYSINSGSTWSTTGTTASTYSFSNLTQNTDYRVVVKNSACAEAISASVTITVRALPTASVSGSNTICAGTTGTLTVAVSNSFGNPWTLTFLEGTTSRTLSGTGDGNFTLTTLTLSVKTDVTLQSILLTHTPTSTNPGDCANSLSSTATVDVIPLPNATLNSVTTPICQGSTSNIQFTISNIATGQAWKLDYTEAGISKNTTGSGPGTFTITTAALTTAGANVVTLNTVTITSSSPSCARTLSGQTMTITVDATTVAGTIAGASTVCKGTNSGTLTYSGGNGTIQRWEYSINSGTTWNTTGTTASTYSFSNLTQNTDYRVIVKNSSCLEAASASVTITVRNLPTATVSGSNTICAGTTGALSVVVTNSFGNPWSISFLEGTTTRTLTGTGDGTFTLTTLTLSTKTDVTLTAITLTHSPTTTNPGNCANSLSSTATVDVIPLPNATLNSVTTPICQGSTSTFSFTISNIATGQAWKLDYTEAGISKNTTGSGPGTFTINTGTLSTAGANVVTLNTVTITSSSPSCARTLSGQTMTITVDATTVAGTIAGASTVCKGSNSGTLTYSGGNGTIQRWEYSINSGATWSTTGTTASTYSFSNLTQNTDYRVVVRNSSCQEATSASVTITVRNLPTATVSGSNTICQGTTGTLTVTVSNSFGNPWDISFLEGTTSRTLSGTGDGNFTLTTLTLSTKTDVTLQSISLTHSPTSTNPGNCANSLSSTATIDIIQLPTATLNSVKTPVCQGSTSSFQYTISNVSTGQAWSLSYVEEGVSKTATGSGPGTYSMNTSTLTTAGKVAITFTSVTVTSTSPSCTRSLSATDTIVVDATTVAGTIAGAATVCKGSNSGTLTYSGGNGKIVRWEVSINGGTTWSTTGTTASTYSYSNLTQDANYRVVVKNSTCSEATSASITIVVRDQPFATISGSTTICQNTSVGLTVTVSNSFGNPWTITYLEGTSTLTFSGSGDGNKTLTTSTLTTTSDVTLQSIILTHSGTSTNPACGPNSLSSTATVNVTPLPTATLNSVVTPICQGNTSSFQFTVSNIGTGLGWSMNYTEGSTSKTTSGNGPGTYTVTTSVLSAGTTTITLKDISTTGLTPNCTRTLTGQTMDITVNATTTVGALGTDVTVCKNNNSGSLSYNVGSSNGAVVRWESSVISAAGPWTSISNTTNTQAYVNISQTTFFRVIVQNGNCAEKASNVITVSVQEIPVAFVGGSSAICAGTTATVSISIQNVAAGQRSILTYLEGTVTKTINIFGASGSITTSVLNTNTDISLISVTSIDTTISSTFRKGCSNTTLTSTATINVNALPTATLTSVGGPICQGNSTTYTVTVTNVPTGQGWNLTGTLEGVSISPVPSGTGSGTFTFNTTVLNNPPSAVVAFSLITNSTTGCTRSLSETKTITVDATTTVGTTGTDATVCKGSNAGSITYTAGSSNGAIVRWEYSTVSPSTAYNGITNTASTQTYSNLTATTYYRAIVKNGACSELASNATTITVRDLPNATISGSQTICEGSSTTFSISVTNTFGQTFRVYYLIGSKLDSLTATGDGTYVISTGTLTNTVDITLLSIRQISGTPQCTQAISGTITITVNDLPKATYSNVPSRLCEGSKITFTIDVNRVKTSESWSLAYNIKAPSSAGAANETATGSGSGTFSITTTATVLPTTSTLTLGTITNTTTGCSRTLSDATVIAVDAVTVGGSVTTSTSTTVCKGANSGTLTLGKNVGSVLRWEYSTDNGSTWTPITNTATTYAYSNITATTLFRAVVQNGVCNIVNSASITITVNDLPFATIGNATICAGNTANLPIVISNTFGQSWTLTFVEGSTTRTLSGTGDGNFTITTGVLNQTTTVILKSIILTTGTVTCSNTLTGVGTANVNDLPTATHDTAPTTVCDGSPVDFTVDVDNVFAGQGWTINYKINSGSTNTKSGSGPGVFTITTPNFTNTTTTMRVDTIKIVSITNTTTGCVRTANVTRTIEVYPKSNGGTTSATVSLLCANSATTSDITVTGMVGKVVRWEYSEDGGATWIVVSSTATTITVSNLSKTRIYRAVILSGPCLPANSAGTTITVIPTIDAQITGAPSICAGKTAIFNVLVSNLGATDNWSLTYRVNGTLQTAMTGKGPGNYPLTVGPPTTSTAGTIVVKLETITNTTYNCANVSLNSQAIGTVNPNPVASFTVSNTCKDSVAVFNNTSTIQSGTIADFTWNMGDGTISKDGNPTHAYIAVGNYSVSLLAVSASGCRDSVTKTITINPRPVADFTFKNTCQDTAVKFTDGSSVGSGGTIKSYFWNFGDGSTSTLQNPSHKFIAAGTYTITLTVVSNNGCGAVKVKNVTVFDLPEPNFVASSVCQNLAMNFVNTSSIGVGSLTYKWDFAGQGTSLLTNPIFTFTGFGSFNVALTAISNNGCVKTLTKPVTVWANPIANFSVAPVCIGDISRFINLSKLPAGSLDVIIENFWNFGDSTFSTGKDPLHIYAKDGIYSVSTRATTDKGCVNSFTGNAVVNPLPVVTFNKVTPFCDGSSGTITTTSGMRKYVWTYNGTVDPTLTTETITVTKQGWYKVRISAPAALGGCENEDSIFVTVWPLPVADAGRDTIIDLGQTVNLVGKGAGILGHYTWSPTTYLSNYSKDSSHVSSKPAVTISYNLRVTDIHGCVDNDSVTVFVSEKFKLIVYNVVTPNNDGKNDTWIIENIDAYPTAKVGIFNRYGMEVYRKDGGYNNEWDGTYKAPGGDNLPDGAYYYVITLDDSTLNVDKHVYTGAINLVRSEVK